MEWVFIAFILTGAVLLLVMQRYAKLKPSGPNLSVVEPPQIEPIVLPDAYKVNQKLSHSGSTIRVVDCESRMTRKLNGKLK